MFKFSFNQGLVSACFIVTSVCILLVIIGVHPIGSQNAQNRDSDSEFNVSSRVEETPEKEEMTIANLKDAEGLRSERLPQTREMRDKKEIEKKPSAASFYGVIVNNNLFRPLGYRKPKQGPSFELVATVIDSENGKSRALVQNNRNRRIHYVTVGETFAGAKVKQIEPDCITLLLDGESKEFHLPQDALLGPIY